MYGGTEDCEFGDYTYPIEEFGIDIPRKDLTFNVIGSRNECFSLGRFGTLSGLTIVRDYRISFRRY